MSAEGGTGAAAAADARALALHRYVPGRSIRLFIHRFLTLPVTFALHAFCRGAPVSRFLLRTIGRGLGVSALDDFNVVIDFFLALLKLHFESDCSTPADPAAPDMRRRGASRRKKCKGRLVSLRSSCLLGTL